MSRLVNVMCNEDKERTTTVAIKMISKANISNLKEILNNSHKE